MSDWSKSRMTVGALATLGVVASAGCASVLTGGVLTLEEAPKYASLAPFDFVRVRFFDEARRPAMEAIDGALRTAGDAIDKLHGRTSQSDKPQPAPLYKPELVPDVSLVTWPAYFTELNYIQLVRPSAELRRFCETKAGQWRVLYRNTDDPVAGLRQNPIAAYLDAHARVKRHLTARGAYAGFEEIRDVMASNVGAELAKEAELNNRRLDLVFAVEGFRYAQRLDAFGLFECEQRDGKFWWASTVPATLVGRDPSSTGGSSMARIAIRIYAARPKV